MAGKRTRPKVALLAALLLLPPVAYAMYLSVLFVLDSYRGDGLMLHQYVFESRRQLALQLLSDARHALPVFYAMTALLSVALYLLTRFRQRSGLSAAALAGALPGGAVAALLVDWSWQAMVPAMIAGLLMSLVLHAVFRPTPVSR